MVSPDDCQWWGMTNRRIESLDAGRASRDIVPRHAKPSPGRLRGSLRTPARLRPSYQLRLQEINSRGNAGQSPSKKAAAMRRGKRSGSFMIEWPMIGANIR
jgi:hypothetical protein